MADGLVASELPSLSTPTRSCGGFEGVKAFVMLAVLDGGRDRGPPPVPFSNSAHFGGVRSSKILCVRPDCGSALGVNGQWVDRRKDDSDACSSRR